jgi:hypothetical protein
MSGTQLEAAMADTPKANDKAPESKSDSKARERSPNYPAITLAEALAGARKLWDKEKRTTVPSEVAAKALGYGALSGSARQALASLRQYGLLEQEAGGVRLSQLALDALHQPEGSPERTEAVTKAAMNPPLISQLANSYRDASDDALRAHLITQRQFSEDGAGKFIRAFRNALSLANPDSRGYDSGASGSSGERGGMETSVVAGQAFAKPRVTMFSWPVAKGVTAEVRFVGDDIQPAHLERLRAYLELAKSAVASDGEADA